MRLLARAENCLFVAAGNAVLKLCAPSVGAGAGLRLVVSADRDEKVRVSRFPDLETIQCFCLGHTSVMASVSVRLGGPGGRDVLLFSGWDHKICLWDPLSGELLHSVVCAEGVEAEEAEVAGAVEGEGEGEGEGDVDEEKKQYDEGSAGHYPHGVLGVGAEMLVAVIFKGLPLMKIYKCTQAQSSSGAGLELEELQTLSLHASAMDVVCIRDSATSAMQLAVLLPKSLGLQLLPKSHGLQLLDLFLSGALTLNADSLRVVAALMAATDSLGFDFALPAGSAGADQPTGMNKHTQDKRFNSAENIDCRIKRASKGSKKKR
ncbi:hypothetical protein B484DRAFT_401296 [Ochromonadaceae sp. CCMP2298]|nr:hypothetical protein B484DRAFT_401296 [Ochromonadaceae sp. CCMP2298]